MKFTGKDFFEKIVDIYHENRKVKTANLELTNNRILTRGRSHISSGAAEDLLGTYIASQIEHFTCIHIDQQFSFPKCLRQTNGPKFFFPDLTLIRNGMITDFVDLKMDIGWNRYGFERNVKADGSPAESSTQPFLKAKLDDLRMRGRNLTISKSDKRDQNRKNSDCNCNELTVSNMAAYHILILSEENAGKRGWDERKKIAEEFEPDGVFLYTLSRNVHPNAYENKEDVKEKICIHENEFDRLIQNLTLSCTDRGHPGIKGRRCRISLQRFD